jgi:hypothetical protein
MAQKTYTVLEFNRLTPVQKVRLKERDPEQYDRLIKELNRSFPKESDHQALAELNVKK